MSRSHADQAHSEGSAFLSLSDVLTRHLDNKLPPSALITKFFEIRKDLETHDIHPSVDALILHMEENLPETDYPEEAREAKKREELRADLASLTSFLEFHLSEKDVSWFPKYFLEMAQDSIETESITPNNGSLEVTLKNGSKVDPQTLEIERHFVRELRSEYKGIDVSVLAVSVDEALIEIERFSRLMTVPLNELGNLQEVEFNRSF